MARTRSVPDLYLLGKVSTLYYVCECTQQEIADRLHLSRPRVSRLLQEAQALGIVQITVSPPQGLHLDLETDLERRFGLVEAQVINVERGQPAEVLRRELGAAAAAHRGWPTTRVLQTALGARNAARFPTRAMLDLRAEYTKPLAIGSLALTIELTNAVNIGNTCCYKLIAGDDGLGGTTFTTRTNDWLPLVPSIGVLWEF